MQPSLEQILAEYPIFRRFVYDRLIEDALRTLPPIEGDLEEFAKREGAVPFEDVIQEIRNVGQAS